MTEAEKHARLRQLDAIVSDLGCIRPMIEHDGNWLDTVREVRALERGLRRFDAAVLEAYLSDVLGTDWSGRRDALPVNDLCKLFERLRRSASRPDRASP